MPKGYDSLSLNPLPGLSPSSQLITPDCRRPCDEKNSGEANQCDFYSIKTAANSALSTAAIEPTTGAAAAPGNGTVEPLDEPGLVPLGAEPEGTGAVPAGDVVGNGGVIEAGAEEGAGEGAAEEVGAALVFSGVSIASGGAEVTSEVAAGGVLAGVVDAGAALAVAAHPHTAAADD